MHFTRFSVLVKALVLVSLSSCTFAKAHPDNQIVPRDQESPRNEARDLVCVQDLILHDLEDAGIQGIDFCLTFIVIPQNTITIPTTSTPLFYTTTTINRTLVATQKIYATSTVTATEYDLLQVAKRAPSPTPTLPAYLKSLVPKGDSEKRPALRKKNASQDSALASSVSSACSCLGVTAGITLFTPVAEPTTISLTAIDYMSGSTVNQTFLVYTTVTSTVISTTHTALPTSFSTATSSAASATAASNSTSSSAAVTPLPVSNSTASSAPTSFYNTTSSAASSSTSGSIALPSIVNSTITTTAGSITPSAISNSTSSETATVSPYSNSTSTGISSTVSESITSASSLNSSSTVGPSSAAVTSLSNTTSVGPSSFTSESTSSLSTLNSTITSSTSAPSSIPVSNSTSTVTSFNSTTSAATAANTTSTLGSNSSIITSISNTTSIAASSASAARTSSSVSSPSSAPSIAALTGCPMTNLTILTTTNGDRYQVQCGIDYPGDDLVGIHRTNLQSCAQLCSNTDLGFSSNACQGISFLPDAVGNDANCYLKLSLGNPTWNDRRVSAVLITNPLLPNATSNNTIISVLPSPPSSLLPVNLTSAAATSTPFLNSTTTGTPSFNSSIVVTPLPTFNFSSVLATELSIEASSTPALNISFPTASITNSSRVPLPTIFSSNSTTNSTPTTLTNLSISAFPTPISNLTLNNTSLSIITSPYTNSSSFTQVSNSTSTSLESTFPSYNLTTETRSLNEPSCATAAASTSIIYVTSIITSIVPTLVAIPTSTNEPVPNPLMRLLGRHFQ